MGEVCEFRPPEDPLRVVQHSSCEIEALAMSMYDKVITTGGVVPKSRLKKPIRSNLTGGATHLPRRTDSRHLIPVCYIAAMNTGERSARSPAASARTELGAVGCVFDALGVRHSNAMDDASAVRRPVLRAPYCQNQ